MVALYQIESFQTFSMNQVQNFHIAEINCCSSNKLIEFYYLSTLKRFDKNLENATEDFAIT
jgi:hypothetical protein